MITNFSSFILITFRCDRINDACNELKSFTNPKMDNIPLDRVLFITVNVIILFDYSIKETPVWFQINCNRLTLQSSIYSMESQ